MLPLVQPYISSLQAYVPGKTIRETKAEYGLKDLVKLASNENAWGPSPMAVEAIRAACTDSHLYPLEMRSDVKARICEMYRQYAVEPEHIMLGNGSNELIVMLTRAFLSETEILLHGWPSFSIYQQSAQAQGRRDCAVPVKDDFSYDLPAMSAVANGKDCDDIKIVFIGNPNNPTGRWLSGLELSAWIESLPEHLIVVIDEAYAEYVTQADYASSIPWALKRPRTVVLRTFSKIYGLAGLRLGYAIGDKDIMRVLHRVRDPFNVNNVAQVAAIAAMSDQGHVERAKNHNSVELPRVREELNKLGISTTPSAGNFILMHLQSNAREAVQSLMLRGVIVRPVNNYGLPNSIRVTIGKPEENDRFLKEIRELPLK